MLGSGWGMICILQSSNMVIGGINQGRECSQSMEEAVRGAKIK